MKLNDIIYERIARANNISVDVKRCDDLRRSSIENARDQVMYSLLVLGIGAWFAHSWALQFEAHLAALLFWQTIISLCLIGIYDVMCVMLVDL